MIGQPGFPILNSVQTAGAHIGIRPELVNHRPKKDAIALIPDNEEKAVEKTHQEPVYALPSCVECWHVLCGQCQVEKDTQGRVLRCCRCEYLTDYTRSHLGLPDAPERLWI